MRRQATLLYYSQAGHSTMADALSRIGQTVQPLSRDCTDLEIPTQREISTLYPNFNHLSIYIPPKKLLFEQYDMPTIHIGTKALLRFHSHIYFRDLPHIDSQVHCFRYRFFWSSSWFRRSTSVSYTHLTLPTKA